jgi:hypothetical protein
MAGSLWALVALVVYPAVQIPLVLFLARWFEVDGDGPLPTPTRAYWNGDRADRETAISRPGVAGRCARCGADNDSSYTFCRSCVTRL